MRSSYIGNLLNSSYLSLQVEHLTESCVYEDVPQGATVSAQTMVYQGGKLDIRMVILNPDGISLYDKVLISNIGDDGKPLPTIVKKGHQFVAKVPGVYGFCLDNRMSRWASKVVLLDIEISDVDEDEDADLLTGEDLGSEELEKLDSIRGAAQSLEEIHETTVNIMRKLIRIESAQMYHHQREQRHRKTIESTNLRVLVWSLVKGTVILGIYFLQVLLGRHYIPSQSGVIASIASFARMNFGGSTMSIGSRPKPVAPVKKPQFSVPPSVSNIASAITGGQAFTQVPGDASASARARPLTSMQPLSRRGAPQTTTPYGV